MHVISMATEHFKVDDSYRPRRSPDSVRILYRSRAREGELIVTGSKWFDIRCKVGGGGAIDLMMHLQACRFQDAVQSLTAGGRGPG